MKTGSNRFEVERVALNALPASAQPAARWEKRAPPTETTAIRRFFLGASLPLFLLAAAAVYEAFLLALVFAPESAGWFGDFAREFRLWCFSADARTGGMNWASVGMMLLEPLFVVGAAALLWRRPLAEARWFAYWRSALSGGMVALAASASLLSLSGRFAARAEALPPFPGERIRTALQPPEFRFTDQTSAEFSLNDARGRVVLVTGIYAACSTACPQILIETKKLLDSLPAEARSRLSIAALSLNPEYETAELMSAVAAGYGFKHPEFRYLNGAPAAMHEVLQQLQFARGRNPQTGLIDHANLLMLIDAEGRIAYRFNLNPKHQAWLREAVLQLTAEAAAREGARVAGP